MQQSASGHAGRLIGQVAQTAVGEVEPGAGLPHEATPQRIIERVHGLALGSTTGVTNRAQVERPPDDRRRGEDLAGRLSGGGEPRAQDGPDPDRHRRERRFTGGERLDDIERQAFGRLDQPVDDVGVRGRCSGKFGDRGTIEPAQFDDDGRRHREAPDDGIGHLVELLRTPGQQHEDRAPGEARRQVVEGFQGRAVGPLQVIEPDAARHGARGQRRQAVRDGGHQPSVGARAVGAGRARATAWGDGRQQAGQFRTDARVTETLHGARVRDGGSQQLHDRAVGDGPLADVRARGEDRAASCADPFDDGLGEPRLADAGLADDGGDPARSGRVRRAGCEQLIQGRIPADEDRGRGSAPAGAGLAAKAGPGPGAGASDASAGSSASRIASYRWLVEASGATPSSRSRIATHSRYWRSAAARSPDRAYRSINRTCPASSRGSRSRRWEAAAIAPGRSPAARFAAASLSSTVITVRSTATARAARQSSNSGLSRRLKPARNGPRARAAAAASDRRESDPASRSRSARSTRTRAGSSATRARSTSTDSGPAAARSDDRVRRRAPFAADASGIWPEQRGKLVARERSPFGAQQARGSPRPCGYPRRVGRRPPAPPAARAAGCRDVATAPWSRRNGTHSPGSLVTF